MADVLDFEVRMKMAEEDIQRMNSQLRSMANNAQNTGEQMDSIFAKVGKTIGTVFATAQLVDFAKQVVNVRKEIEGYEISFRTLLGSQEKADALFGSLREFAVKTPMQLGDLAKGAQTLLGFGIEAEKIMPTLKQIGDISMGNADKFGSLTLAFAQMSSSGKLMGQDLMQMINAGFNPLGEMAKATGKSIGELKEEMSQGAITAEMVAEAFKSATSEGGMFYGMLEKQSEGIEGAISNLEGAWEDALNSIGERTQGIIVTSLKGATTLVENYDKLISVILGVASAYGTYKAALMATVAINQAKMFADNIRLIAMFRKELGLLKAAQQAFNLTAMKNPYILLASAIVGVGVALYSFINRTDEATKKQEEFNKTLGERASDARGKVEKLSLEWEKMGDNIKAKEQYIIDNKSTFEELGVAINSVAEAEDLLVKNKDKFIEAQVAKAKAALYQEQANDLIAKQVENEQKIESLKANPYTKEVKDLSVAPYTTATGQTIWSYKTVEDTEKTNKEIKKLLDENAKLQEDINKALGKSITDISTGQAGEGKPIQNITEEIKKYQAELKKAKQLLDDLRSGKVKSTDLTGDIDKTEKRIKELQEKLDKLRGVKTTSSSDERATTYGKKAEEEAQRMKDENYKNQLRHEAELAKIRGNNLEEYYNKQQELIDKEHQDKLRNIEAERKEALKNANKESRKKINDAYDKQVIAAAEEYGLKTEKNTQAYETETYNQRLNNYRKYMEEYLRIGQEKEERAKAIRKMQKEGQITEENAQQRLETSENVALAEKTTLQAELGLTAEEVSALISETVTSTVGMSLDRIRNELPALESELKRLKKAGADPDNIVKLEGKIKTMKRALGDAKNATTGISEETKETAEKNKANWNIVANSLGTVNNALNEVMNTFGDMMSDSAKTSISIMQTTLQATTSVIQAITSVSATSFAAMSAAEKATVILAIISAAVQVITAITNAIMKNFSAAAIHQKKMEEYDRELEHLEKRHEDIKREYQNKTGVDYWQKMAESVEEYHKSIRKAQEALKEAQDEQKRLAEKYGEDSKKAQEAQAEVDEYESVLNDYYDDRAEELKEIFEQMATTDVSSFGESMANALVDSFSQGLDGMSGAWEDTINDMIKSMLTQRMALQLTDQFEKAFKDLEEATSSMSTGGVEITDYEMEQFLANMDSARTGAMAIGEEYKKIFAEMGLLDDADIEAESKGFQSMSQDTADELNGRFTALQISGANIEVQLGQQLQLDKEALLLSQSIRDNIELSTQIATQQLQELRTISKNTSLLEETNRKLKTIEEHTSRL